MGRSYKRKDIFGDTYWENGKGDRKYLRKDIFGDQYTENNKGQRTYKRKDMFGDTYYQNDDGKKAYKRKDMFGNNYIEGEDGHRSYKYKDIFGDTYWETDSHPDDEPNDDYIPQNYDNNPHNYNSSNTPSYNFPTYSAGGPVPCRFSVKGIVLDSIGIAIGSAILLLCYSIAGDFTFSLSNIGHLYPEATVWYVILTIVGYPIFAMSFSGLAERLADKNGKKTSALTIIAKIIKAPVIVVAFMISTWYIWLVLAFVFVLVFWGLGGHFTSHGY